MVNVHSGSRAIPGGVLHDGLFEPKASSDIFLFELLCYYFPCMVARTWGLLGR
jgi:hypothetical protein